MASNNALRRPGRKTGNAFGRFLSEKGITSEMLAERLKDVGPTAVDSWRTMRKKGRAHEPYRLPRPKTLVSLAALLKMQPQKVLEMMWTRV